MDRAGHLHSRTDAWEQACAATAAAVRVLKRKRGGVQYQG